MDTSSKHELLPKTRIWQEEVATSFGCMGLNMFARNDSRMPGLKCAVHPECFSDKYLETQHLDSKRQYKLSAANLIPTSTLDKQAAGVMYPTTEAVRINMCNLASHKPQGKQEDFPHTLQSPQHGNGKRFVQILTHFPTAWWSCILGKCLGYPSVWPRHMEWIPPRCSGVEGLVLQHPSCTRRFTLLFQHVQLLMLGCSPQNMLKFRRFAIKGVFPRYLPSSYRSPGVLYFRQMVEFPAKS